MSRANERSSVSVSPRKARRRRARHSSTSRSRPRRRHILRPSSRVTSPATSRRLRWSPACPTVSYVAAAICRPCTVRSSPHPKRGLTTPTKFKTPWEWTISALRGVGHRQVGDMQIAALQTQLGQRVWKSGSPAGWDDVEASLGRTRRVASSRRDRPAARGTARREHVDATEAGSENHACVAQCRPRQTRLPDPRALPAPSR